MSYLTAEALDRMFKLCPNTLKNIDQDAQALAEEVITKYNSQPEHSAEKFISIAISTVAKYLLTDRAKEEELDTLLIYFESLFDGETENPVGALIGVFTYYLLEKPYFDSYRHLISSYVFDETDLGEIA